MNNIQGIMKFELLSNEVLIECFEYFNAFDLFYSFDQLNSRFNHLIRHIPLHINIQDVNKSLFDQFCTKILLNPEIKDQVYSLKLSDEYKCLQSNMFLSYFSLNEFSHLQKFQSMLPLMPHSEDLPWIDPSSCLKIKLTDLLLCNLRSLSISIINWPLQDIQKAILFITIRIYVKIFTY